MANQIAEQISLQSQIYDLGLPKGEYVRMKEAISSLPNKVNVSDEIVAFYLGAILDNTDILSTNGSLKEDARYVTTEKFVVDQDKYVFVSGTSYKYLYCYKADDSYIGRLAIEPTGTKLSWYDNYKNTAYCRVLAKMEEKDAIWVGYEPTAANYNPIKGYISGVTDFVTKAKTYFGGVVTTFEPSEKTYIDGSKWHTNGTAYKGQIFRVIQGTTVTIKAKSDVSTNFALIKEQDIVIGNSVQFTMKYSSKINVEKGTKTSLIVPEDAAYLYVSCVYGNSDISPEYVEISSAIEDFSTFDRDSIVYKKNCGIIKSWIYNKTPLSTTGAIRDDSGWAMTDYIAINPNVPYCQSGAYNDFWYCYDENKNWIGRITAKTILFAKKTGYEATRYIIIISTIDNIKNIHAEIGTNLFNVSFAEHNEISGYIIDSTDSNVVSRNSDMMPIVSAISYSNALWTTGYPRKKYLTFAHFSDIHGDYQRCKNVIDFANAIKEIDFSIHTGDSERGYWGDGHYGYETSLGAIIPTSKKPVFNLIGNHDAGYNDNAVCTYQQMFDRYFKPNLDNMGLPSSYNKMYYYKDFSSYKVRLIVLNEYETPRTIDTNNPSKYLSGHDCWRRYISQEQVTWFADTLKSTPSDYHVIIAMHQPTNTPDVNEFVNNPFVDHNYTHNGPSEWKTNQDAVLIQEIVDAWISKTTLSKTYRSLSNITGSVISTIPSVTVNADFSSRSASNFVCYICGHTHIDMIAKVSGTNNKQLIVNVTQATADYEQNFDDTRRIKNSRAEDTFNVMSIDTDNRKIKLARIGNNMPTTLVERKFTVIDY